MPKTKLNIFLAKCSSTYKAFQLYLRKIKKTGKTIRIWLSLENYLPTSSTPCCHDIRIPRQAGLK